MNKDIHLIKNIANSKKKWNLTEVDALYNIYRSNNFGSIQDHSPAREFKEGDRVRRVYDIGTDPNYIFTIDHISHQDDGRILYYIVPINSQTASPGWYGKEGIVEETSPGVRPRELF